MGRSSAACGAANFVFCIGHSQKLLKTCDKCLNKLGDMLKNECTMPKVFKFEVLNS